MSVLSWPHDFLTLDDWIALPETPEFRFEVVEGVLIVSPRPLSFHQRAVTRLGYLINEQLPAEYSALSEVDVVLVETPLTVRAPDVMITETVWADKNPARYHAGDVRLAIEVLSEGSVRTDKVTKFSEYAEVGIEHYWIVDLDAPASITTYALIDGEYEDFGEHAGVVNLEFAGAPLVLDLNALTTARAQRL
ncbi:Uma2 family endonuclease [Amycolatopsis sp. H20-H5]|uniref:Uma2 family endonuclease n=1 Tax=Amycolatopsis sp. H20-H5 TaxID=3046309 RepID=UPI002DBE7A35|nr:Uma2 family endonuclease [Amycolatopsis sp. H20-H5]MEC3980533.1 Uma2 family endonuclease [Amycolatopsis sp. H20-H5]